jgi:RNA polymerase sigma-70 factor, ECF subfamily
MEPTSNNLEPTDHVLLAAIAKKESWALAEFYDRYAGLLNALAYRVLNQSQEAEDVVQEAFLLIWHKSGSYDSRLGLPRTWAITLTRNKAIDRLRARQRRNAILVEELEDAPPAPDLHSVPPEDALDQQETAVLVRTALAELPQEQRHPIELAFFKGLTHPEIADALREPLGTIKARIRRGMLKLREPLLGLRAS